MITGSSRSYWRVAWLVLGVMAVRPLVAEAAPSRGRGTGLSVTVERIGRAEIGAESRPSRSSTTLVDTAFYYVGLSETVAVTVSGSLPPRAHLYPLVRRYGTDVWTVQPAAVGPGGRNVAGSWAAEVRFGRAADEGARFELLFLIAASPLPPVPLPEGVRAASALAQSAVIRVERRRERPEVAISAVGSQYVYGNAELRVLEEAPVEVTARDLPAGSQVGVVVQPADIGEHWVMPGTAAESGSIRANFGTGDGSEKSFHFTISAFVAFAETWPPVGRGLSAPEWQQLQVRFLARSRPVPVVRWEDHWKIEEIGRAPVRRGLIHAVDRQVDVHGAAKRPLAPGEKIWLVCIPLEGDPWVAGWTSRLSASGHWGIKAVLLDQEGKPEIFDVVAAVSDEDAIELQAQPGALRAWLNDAEGEDASSRIRVLAAGAKKAASAVAPGTKP